MVLLLLNIGQLGIGSSIEKTFNFSKISIPSVIQIATGNLLIKTR
jgi:hypothetical protein